MPRGCIPYYETANNVNALSHFSTLAAGRIGKMTTFANWPEGFQRP
jgi:hypothetical protein